MRKVNYTFCTEFIQNTHWEFHKDNVTVTSL